MGATEAEQTPLEHELRLRVRYAETDQGGVVYHANHLVWLDEGRTALLASLGFPYHELERSGDGLVVRKATLRYVSPAVLGDEVLVRTRVERVRSASIVFGYELARGSDGGRIAHAEVELCCISLTGKRAPKPIPEPLRGVLARAQAPRGRSSSSPNS